MGNFFGGIMDLLMLPFKLIGGLFQGLMGMFGLGGGGGSGGGMFGGLLGSLFGMGGDSGGSGGIGKALNNMFNGPSSDTRVRAPAEAPTSRVAPRRSLRQPFSGSAAPTDQSAAYSKDGLHHTFTGRFIDGLEPGMKTYVSTLKGVEGHTQNPWSNASGQYQFMDDTWLGCVRQYAKDYPDAAYRKLSNDKQTSDADVMALKNINDDFKDYIFIRMTQSNFNQFERSTGVKPNPKWGYVCHQQGAGGAATIYKAMQKDPNTRMINVLSKMHGGARTLPDGDTRKGHDFSKAEMKQLSLPEKKAVQNGCSMSTTVAQFVAGFGSRFENDFAPTAPNNMAVARNTRSPATPQASSPA